MENYIVKALMIFGYLFVVSMICLGVFYYESGKKLEEQHQEPIETCTAIYGHENPSNGQSYYDCKENSSEGFYTSVMGNAE